MLMKSFFLFFLSKQSIFVKIENCQIAHYKLFKILYNYATITFLKVYYKG